MSGRQQRRGACFSDIILRGIKERNQFRLPGIIILKWNKRREKILKFTLKGGNIPVENKREGEIELC